MLNCNANVIPRLSGWGKCQLLRAKAIGKAERVNLTKRERHTHTHKEGELGEGEFKLGLACWLGC